MTYTTRILACIGALALPSAALAADAVFVPLGDANAIVEVDTVTDTVKRSIGDVPAVHGLAVTPDGTQLVAGSFATRSADETAPAKPADMSEDEHAAHHGGGDKAASPASPASVDEISSVSIIDIKTGNITRRIDVPGAVHHVAIGRDGELAAVTHPGIGAVSLIDLSSFAIVATIETGSTPNYSIFSPDGQRLYVSNGGAGTISEVDTKSLQVTRSIQTGTAPEHLVLTKDGQTLFVNDVDGGAVFRVDTRDFELKQTIEIGSVLHGIDLSQDEKSLFVAVLGDDVMAQVDLQTGQITRKDAGPSPYHLMRVADGDKLYLSSSEQSVIRVVDAVSLNVRKEIPVEGIAHQMATASTH